MKINKNIIGSLLGGGASITIASLGGLKLNDHTDYQKKVKYFSKYTENVRLKAPDHIKKQGYYLPKWEDDTIWNKWHHKKTLDNPSENWKGDVFKSKYPTPKHYRDYCFEEAKKDENLTNCDDQRGWCNDCLRDPLWDK